jgi:hypothetical protein
VKVVVVITDSEAMKEFERAFVESGGRGFTILPALVGRGKTGLKTGDRVHPGGSSLLFTVLPEGELAAALAFLREVRDRTGAAESTKIYVAGADEVS